MERHMSQQGLGSSFVRGGGGRRSSQCPGVGGALGYHVRRALGRWVAGGWQPSEVRDCLYTSGLSKQVNGERIM